MTTEPRIIMSIRDIFHFKESRTVFSGLVDDSLVFISPCTCELYIKGIPVAILRLEGEMLPLHKKTNLRAVSTTDKFDWEVLRRALPDAELREWFGDSSR